MRNLKSSALIVLLASVTACGQQLVDFPNSHPPSIPTVTSTDPANLETGVGSGRTVNATFSEQMDPSTINTTTFTLMQGTTAVAGTVGYAGLTATFAPASDLASGTTFTASIGTGARSTAYGASVKGGYTWSFTTLLILPTPPSVVSTDPLDLATGVPTSQQVSAIFNGAMDPASINATTVILADGAGAISGTVTYAGTTLQFAPASPLANSTTYTATILTGVTDLAGVNMAADYVWTFTTTAPTPPSIVATSPATNATAVPTFEQLSASFSTAMDPTTLNPTTFTLAAGATPVAGTVNYSGTTALFVSAGLLATSTTYTATVTAAAKDLAGVGLAAPYVWSFTTAGPTAPAVISTNPGRGATGVATSPAISATFSKAMDPATITTTTFTVVDGTTPIAGTVSYAGTTATFAPAGALTTNSTCTATVSTGAKDVAGLALAANYVWQFTTISPGSPTVIATDPGTGATGVATFQAVSATFSVAMNPATIDSTTFTLMAGTTPVDGAVSCTGTIAQFVPTGLLTNNTTYTATVTTGAADLVGMGIPVDYIWSFTTGAPTITSTSPVNNATGVATLVQVAATFSRAMDPATINTLTFTLTDGLVPVAGTVGYTDTTATFAATSLLTNNTTYTATVTTGATDIVGIGLAANYVWSFTTGAPTVTSTNPDNNAVGVATDQQISATFSRAMDPATIGATTFTVMDGLAPVTGTISYNGNTVTFSPATLLTNDTTYTVMITTGATDAEGVSIAADYVWSFTTGAPKVNSTVPVNAATGVPANQQLSAIFNRPMDPTTINTTTFTLTDGTTAVAGIVSYSGTTALFVPTNLLANEEGLLNTEWKDVDVSRPEVDA